MLNCSLNLNIRKGGRLLKKNERKLRLSTVAVERKYLSETVVLRLLSR